MPQQRNLRAHNFKKITNTDLKQHLVCAKTRSANNNIMPGWITANTAQTQRYLPENTQSWNNTKVWGRPALRLHSACAFQHSEFRLISSFSLELFSYSPHFSQEPGHGRWNKSSSCLHAYNLVLNDFSLEQLLCGIGDSFEYLVRLSVFIEVQANVWTEELHLKLVITNRQLIQS